MPSKSCLDFESALTSLKINLYRSYCPDSTLASADTMEEIDNATLLGNSLNNTEKTLGTITLTLDTNDSDSSSVASADTMEEIDNATLLENSPNKRKHNTVFLPTKSNIILNAQNTGQKLVATILTKVIDYRVFLSVLVAFLLVRELRTTNFGWIEMK